MAELQDISTFTSSFIAIYRPNKKTYSILEWVSAYRYWKRSLLDPDIQNTITICTRVVPPAVVQIKIDRSANNNVERYVKCIVYGKHLVYGTNLVPIIQKRSISTRNFPNSMFAGEFACTNTSIEVPANINTTLWTLRVPAPVIPVPVNAIQIEPLPQRIAWLVAEDACKRDEICSITLEPISPITASVTSCFHTFETNAIEKWLISNPLCPMCKKKTTSTKAFT